MPLTMAVIFGSKTCEHDVSIISGLQALSAVNPVKYRAIPIYISREGEWYTGNLLRNIEFYRSFVPSRVTHVLPVPRGGKIQLIEHPDGEKFFGRLKVFDTIDIVLPVMHGMNGEDGTLQGMLEMWNVPYTSSGVLGSAVGMDKIVMKQVFRGFGFPVLPDMTVNRSEWEKNRDAILDGIERTLKYPLYCKPANLGSSIGISRADDRASLAGGIDIAVAYDKRVMVEKGVAQIKEVNCSVLGYGDDVRASVLEMPIRWDDAALLDFNKKYLSGTGGKGMESMNRRIPAPIDDALTDKIRGLSVDVFKALDSKGVVRIDYMIDETDNSVYIGEINTIPGSLALSLWEAMNITFSELLDIMAESALIAHADKQRNVFTYDSTILSSVASGTKMAK